MRGFVPLCCVASVLLTAGCFGPQSYDFEMSEVSRFVIGADNGGGELWCIADIDYDGVQSEVWLLDYDQGVHRFTPEGAYLGSELPPGEWNDLRLKHAATIGDGSGLLLTGSASGTALRMDLGDDEPLPHFGEALQDAPLTVDTSRARVLAAPGEGRIAAYDLDTGALVTELVIPHAIHGIAYVADEDLIFATSSLGLVHAVDPISGDVVATGIGSSVQGFAYDADRGVFYTVNFSLGSFTYVIKTFAIAWN